MAKKYKVVWTQESKMQTDHILDFIKTIWTDKEASNFLDLLLHFENTISHFPKSFKESLRFKGCRLGLVHKHVTAVYKITKDQITILTVFDNRTNIER